MNIVRRLIFSLLLFGPSLFSMHLVRPAKHAERAARCPLYKKLKTQHYLNSGKQAKETTEGRNSSQTMQFISDMSIDTVSKIRTCLKKDVPCKCVQSYMDKNDSMGELTEDDRYFLSILSNDDSNSDVMEKHTQFVTQLDRTIKYLHDNKECTEKISSTRDLLCPHLNDCFTDYYSKKYTKTVTYYLISLGMVGIMANSIVPGTGASAAMLSMHFGLLFWIPARHLAYTHIEKGLYGYILTERKNIIAALKEVEPIMIDYMKKQYILMQHNNEQ